MPCHQSAGQNLIKPLKVTNNSLRKCGKLQIFMKGSIKSKKWRRNVGPILIESHSKSNPHYWYWWQKLTADETCWICSTIQFRIFCFQSPIKNLKGQNILFTFIWMWWNFFYHPKERKWIEGACEEGAEENIWTGSWRKLHNGKPHNL